MKNSKIFGFYGHLHVINLFQIVKGMIKSNNKKQIQETSYFLNGRQKKRRLTEEPPRRILFLTLAKFKFNRDGKGVLNSPPPKNTLYCWSCSQRQMSHCISLCPLFPEPTAGKEQAKRLGENARNPRICKWVYSLLAGAAAEAPEITINTHNPSGLYQVKLLWHTTQSSPRPSKYLLTRYKWSQLLHNWQSHCLQNMGWEGWTRVPDWRHLVYFPTYSKPTVTYPTTFSENKQKTRTNWLSNTLHWATDSRPTGKNMEEAGSHQKSHPWLDTHGPTVGTGHTIGASPWGRKGLNSTSGNPAFKIYIWETGPPKYWLLKATGTCAHKTHTPVAIWEDSDRLLREDSPSRAQRGRIRSEWAQALCAWVSFACRGVSAWRQATDLTATWGPAAMISAGQPDGLAAIFECFQGVNISPRWLVRMSGTRCSAWCLVFSLVAGLVWFPVLRLVPCFCSCH